MPAASAALSGLLLSSTLFAGAPALADEVPGVEEQQPTTLEGVTVTGQRPRTSIASLPSEIRDTPQVINVISSRVLEQQNVTTLEQALRNVPGITLSIGEGNGGLNGDQFRIRGLDAKDDLYIDGLRDFGVYTRDSFNYEQIEVLKGPSGATLGRGTTGGAINTTSKSPQLSDFAALTAGAGTADFGRATVDWNRQLGETGAVRINLMATRSGVEGRDLVEADRWGVAPSIAFGLGTPTEVRLGYLHQEGSGRPDFGVPVIAGPGDTIGRPVTEFGVDRANFYGYRSDLDETTTDIVTLKLAHAASETLSFNSSTRLGWYDRDFGASAGGCSATALVGGQSVPCVTAFFDDDPATVPLVSAGGTPGYVQESWGVQNVSTLLLTAPVAGRRNELLMGVDVSVQDNDRDQFSFVGVSGVDFRPPLNLLDPDNAFDNLRQADPGSARHSEGKDYSAFISDQVWLTDALSVVGGLRVQRYEADYTTVAFPTAATPDPDPPTRLQADSTLVNPKASVLWRPDATTTAYLSWARSATPVGTSIASAPNTIGNPALSDLEPEENETFEAGLKLGLPDTLLFQGSIFQIDKNNAKEIDPGGTIVSSGDGQRVRGVEMAVTGAITPAWSLVANYTYLDAEIVDSTTATNIGNLVQFVPENSASLWTTYEIGSFTLGGGVTYQDEMFLNATNTAVVPENVSIDALVSYQWNNLRLALNGYNLADELNYGAVFGNRAVPSAGRSAVLTLSASF